MAGKTGKKITSLMKLLKILLSYSRRHAQNALEGAENERHCKRKKCKSKNSRSLNKFQYLIFSPTAPELKQQEAEYSGEEFERLQAPKNQEFGRGTTATNSKPTSRRNRAARPKTVPKAKNKKP